MVHQYNHHMATLHLFDIDGTLVKLQGSGRIAFDRAMERLFGKERLTHEIPMAGTTDLATFHAVMDKMQIPNGFEEYWRHFERLFAAELTALIQTTPYVPFNGVIPFLEMLRDRTIQKALITGNMRVGADIKLACAGLAGFFSCGAYGDDALTRNELADIVVDRCKQTFCRSFDTIIMWGDTPLDIEAGKHIQAITVAIIGGMYTKDQLAACKPNFIIENFLTFPSELNAIIDHE